MTKVIGVRFRNNGKVYYFDPKDFTLRNGGQVIVETARGMECGSVVLSPREVPDERVQQPLRPVIRLATEEDLERERSNREKEKEAFQICRQKIRERGLDMKLIKAEFTFDNKKVLFYFTADGRVDFRELVKDLAAVFKTRIELRQIGVRDETKLLGGIGICGRPLCCSTFLSDFSSVSIRMAKEQNLSLNPTKISGTCGRLMCCLKNEQETYEYLNKRLPGVGDIVSIADREETGEVQTVNVLRQTVRVLIEEGDDKEMEEFPADQLEVVMTRRRKNKERAKEREKERERAKAEKELAAQLAEDPSEEKPEGKVRERNRQKNPAQGEERAETQNRTEKREKPYRDGKDGKDEKNGNAGRGGKNTKNGNADREGKNERAARPERNEKRSGRNERAADEPANRTADAAAERSGEQTGERTGRRGRRRRHRDRQGKKEQSE